MRNLTLGLWVIAMMSVLTVFITQGSNLAPIQTSIIEPQSGSPTFMAPTKAELAATESARGGAQRTPSSVVLQVKPGMLLQQYVNSIAEVDDSNRAEEIQNALVQSLSLNPGQGLDEIQRILSRLPHNRFPVEKLKLLEVASRLPGMEREAAQIALQLGTGELHESSRGSEDATPFERFELPLGAFEIFVTKTQAEANLIAGAAQMIAAQESASARRLALRYFKAEKPELFDDLNQELQRNSVNVTLTSLIGA